MTETLLQWLLAYGITVLTPVIAGAALGLPLPASLLLLAGGAFAGGGQFGLAELLCGAFAGAVTGDLLGFWIGRRGGEGALARWGGRLRISPETVARGERTFARWGGLSVLLTRFLLTPLGPVINVVAGTSRYPVRSFVLYDALGEGIWVALYVGLGLFFSTNWDVLASLLGNATLLLTLLVITVVVGFLLVRTLVQRHDREVVVDESGAEMRADEQRAD
jgi:membrane-associated protein